MRIYGICNTSQCDALKISRNLENVPSAAPSLVGFLRFLLALILRSLRLICMKSSNLPNRTDSCPIWRTFRRNAFERGINLFLSIRLKTFRGLVRGSHTWRSVSPYFSLNCFCIRYVDRGHLTVFEGLQIHSW